MKNLAETFAAGPFLGIDWGECRIGVALSDPENHIALALKVFKDLSYNKVIHELQGIWAFYNLKALVVGWTRGKNAEAIRRFCHILPQEWPICLWDESLTTVEALERMSWDLKSGKSLLSPHHSKHMSRHPIPGSKKSHGNKHFIDHHAAAVILSDALHQWRFLRQQQERNTP